MGKRGIIGKVKRTVSILLTAAMIITMIPQTAMPVYAKEVEEDEEDVVADGIGEYLEVDAVTPEEKIEEPTGTSETPKVPEDDRLTVTTSDGTIDAGRGDDNAAQPYAVTEAEGAGVADVNTYAALDESGKVTVAFKIPNGGNAPKAYTGVGTDHFTITDTDHEDANIAGNTDITIGTNNSEGYAYEDYTFTVKPSEGYKIATDGVQYYLGDYERAEDLKPLTADSRGSDDNSETYTISNENALKDLTDSGSLTIVVTVVRVHTVTLNYNNDNKKISSAQYALGGADFSTDGSKDSGGITNDLSITVERGQNLKLKVVPVDQNYTGIVKVYGARQLQETDEPYVYDIGPVTRDMTIDISAERAYGYTVWFKPVKSSGGNEITNVTGEWLNGIPTEEGGCTIGKNEALIFKLNLDKLDKTETIEGVYYGESMDMEPNAATTPITPDEKGYYIIKAADIKKIESGHIVVKAVIRDKGETRVTLGEGTKGVKVTYKKDDGDVIEWSEIKSDSGDIKVNEGEIFYFQAKAEDFLKIKDVTAEAKPTDGSPTRLTVDNSQKDSNGNTIYSFVATNAENTTISIETESDYSQYYKLELKINGEEDSASVSVGLPTEDGTSGGNTKADQDIDGEKVVGREFEKGNFIIYTRNPELRLTVATTTDYELVEKDPVVFSAAGDGVVKWQIVQNTTNQYDLVFGESKAAVLTVSTRAAELGEEKAVTFQKDPNADHIIEYEVKTTDDQITLGTGDQYTLRAKVRTLDFTVTAESSYEPVVTYGEGGKTTAEAKGKPVKGTGADGKTTYTYSYSLIASKLQETGEVINISQQAITHTVTVIYDADEVGVKVKYGTDSKDPKDKNSGWTKGNKNDYTRDEKIDDGAVLNFTLTALDNSTITKIETAKGGADAASLAGFPAKGSTYHNFQITVDDDIVIRVTTNGAYVAKPLAEIGQSAGGGYTETELTPNNKGVYSVHYDGTYKAAVTKGASDKLAEISGFKVMEGKNVITSSQIVEPKKANEVHRVQVNYTAEAFKSGESTDVTITLTENLAGKNLTFQLYCEGADGETLAASYSLSVYKEIVDTNVKINNNKDISQTADTFKTYKVTATGGADVNMIQVETAAKDVNHVISDVAIRDGKLELTTGYGVGESIELLFYTGNEDNKEYILKSDGTPLSINVTTTALLDQTAAPTVKLASATDVSLKLSLSSNKSIATSATDNVYYEIQVIPDKGEDSEDKINTDTQTLYRKRTGNTQEETVYVGESGALNNPSYGTGKEWNFTVKVRLVHTTEDLSDDSKIGDGFDIDNILVGATKPAADLSCSTKQPLYETNLKLTKKTTTIYTGQTVTVAIPQYSKDAAVIALSSASDITVGVPNDNRLTVVGGDLKDDKVTLTASSGTAPGKHTIEVIAAGKGTSDSDSDTMYASRATIDVTVVRGIEGLAVVIPSTSIYKGDKAASMNATVTYNGGKADQVPKAKKVEWYLVKEDFKETDIAGQTAGDESEDAIDAITAIKNAAPAAAKGNLASIKNGKVSINKNYIVKADPAENTFRILVKAADFADNWTIALSDPITITRDKIEIAQAAIIGKVADENGVKQDTVLANDTKTNRKWPATTVNGSRLVAFAPGKSSYDAGDAEDYGIGENITYSSSNKKAVEIDAEGKIKVLAPANNITLTAAAADGSDSKINKQSVKVSVGYDETGELGLQIEKYNQYHTEGTFNIPTDKWDPEKLEAANRTITFNDSSAATFKLTVMQQVPDTASGAEEDSAKETKMKWADTEAFTNYKVTVSGGKILQKEEGDGSDIVRIVATAKAAKVKLTNNANKVTREYTLKNEGLANAAAKAPKVTLSEKGTIDATRYADKSLTVTIAANGKNYPLADALAYGGLYAKVDIDWSAMTAKNQAALKLLSDAITNPVGYIKLDPGSKFNLTFKEGTLPTGSYKLKVSIGTIGNAGGGCDFVLAAQPAALTLKVGKNKTPSFKPTTSYKLSAKDNGYVELTGKGTYTGYKFTKLFNSNISKDEKNKDIKGVENNFTTYFELDPNSNILRLTDACFADGNLKTIPSGELTGYVSYEAWYGWYGGEEVSNSYRYTKLTGTVKITIKMTDLNRKYAISNASADNKADGMAKVTITVDKKYDGYVRYAMVVNEKGEEDSSSVWSVVSTDEEGSGIEIGNDEAGDYVIQLKHKDALTDSKQKSQKVRVKIIPSDSYYADKIASVDDDQKLANQKAIIQEYGIPLTTTITMSDMTTAKGRIKINAKDLKQTFSGEFSNDDKGFTYDEENGKGCYYVNVPVTEVYDKVIEKQINYISITNITKGFDLKNAKDGITFEAISGKGEGEPDGPYIKVSLKKSYLVKNWYKLYTYDSKKKAYTPKTLSVTVDVRYWNVKYSTVKDTFTFSLTMPGLPAIMTDGGTEKDFASAVAAIKDQAAEPLTPGVGIKGKVDWHIHYEMNDYLDAKWRWEEDYASSNAKSADKTTIIQEDVAEYLVQNAIREYIDDDSGINFDKTTWEVKTTQNRGADSHPGKFEVTVIFAKGSETETTKSDDNSATFEFTIKAAGTTISDITSTVSDFLDKYTLDTGITDEAEQKALINQYLQSGLEAAGYNLSNIRFIIEITDWTRDETGRGTFGVEVTIYDTVTLEAPETPVTRPGIPIPAYRTGADIKAAIEKAVGVTEPDGGSTIDQVITALTESNNEVPVKAAVREAALSVIHEKEDFSVKYAVNSSRKDVFAYEPAGADSRGKLSFTLVVTDRSGKKELTDSSGNRYEITLTVPSDGGNVPAKPHYLTPQEAAKRVKAWIEANTVEAEDYDESGNLKSEKSDKMLKNGITAAEIIAEIQPQKNPEQDDGMVIWADSNIRVSFRDGTFQRKDARVNDDGYVKGTIVLADKYVSANSVTAPLDAVIPVLPQTPEQAKDAVLTAIKELAAGELRKSAVEDKDGSKFLALVKGKLGSGKNCTLKADYDIAWDTSDRFTLQDVGGGSSDKYVVGTINIVYAADGESYKEGASTKQSVKIGKTVGENGVEVTVIVTPSGLGFNPDAEDDTDYGERPDDYWDNL